MSVTYDNIKTLHDKFIRDTSTDRVSLQDRYDNGTEAVAWLKEHLGNEHEQKTYTLSYFDTIARYNMTTAVPSFFDVSDLRRSEDDHDNTFTRKAPREIAEELNQGSMESCFAIERYDSKLYLLINHASKYPALPISTFDALDAGGGTWTADTTNSDATNLTVDSVEFQEGNASLNFDVDVSQSANDRATIYNSTLNAIDLTGYEDLASFFMDVYVPDVTEFSSVTLYWGSSDSAYWSATVTTTHSGAAFAAGWNTIKIDWSAASMTSTPDVSAITYVRIDLNYTGSQTDDTDFRIDDLRLVRPEKLTLIYLSHSIGANASGVAISSFGATDDAPYFSGQYDQYKFPVAHMMAALTFDQLGLKDDAMKEESRAYQFLDRIKKSIPTSRLPITKSFKVNGISFRRRR